MTPTITVNTFNYDLLAQTTFPNIVSQHHFCLIKPIITTLWYIKGEKKAKWVKLKIP